MRAELDYCVPLGIPHSVFLGRIVRSGDPVWLPSDQDKALAWRADKAARCDGCGTLRDEWDPAKGGTRDAYVAHVETCPGCEALDSTREQIDKGGSTHGVKVGLLPAGDPRLTDDDEDDDTNGA